MAFEKTGKVVSIEWAESAKGRYMKATLQEAGENPRTQSIFDEDYQKTIQTAKENDYTIDWTLEKPGGAKYWNITHLALHQPQETMAGQPADPSKAAPAPPASSNGKDAQIARAVALKAAVEASRGQDTARIITMAEQFMPFLMGTPTLTEHAKALVEEGVLESAVVNQAALKGLAAIAKDAKEWSATVAEKNQWLRDTAKEMFGKDIKEITEDELSDLTAKLAEHIKEQQTEENPF